MSDFFFAQKAFIVHDGKLLAIQKSEDCPFYPGYWEVPGGRMDPGETEAEHIKREVKEEVGIEIEPGAPFHIWDWRVGDAEPGPRVVAVARLAEALSLEISTDGQEDGDNIGDIRWIPLAELKAYKWIPNFVAAIDMFLERYASQHAA